MGSAQATDFTVFNDLATPILTVPNVALFGFNGTGPLNQTTEIGGKFVTPLSGTPEGGVKTTDFSTGNSVSITPNTGVQVGNFSTGPNASINPDGSINTNKSVNVITSTIGPFGTNTTINQFGLVSNATASGQGIGSINGAVGIFDATSVSNGKTQIAGGGVTIAAKNGNTIKTNPFTGNLSVNGGGLNVTGGTTTDTLLVSGQTNTNGINNNGGGITNAGAISGVTTLTASGNITTTGELVGHSAEIGAGGITDGGALTVTGPTQLNG